MRRTVITCYDLSVTRKSVQHTCTQKESSQMFSPLSHFLFSLLKGFSEELKDATFRVKAHSSMKLWSDPLSDILHQFPTLRTMYKCGGTFIVSLPSSNRSFGNCY